MLGQIQLRKEIADRLKIARIKAGYKTPDDFCLKLELNCQEYKRHEAGEISLRASRAIQYCEYLHISLHWLMLGEEFIGREGDTGSKK